MFMKPSKRHCAYLVAVVLLAGGMWGCPEEQTPPAATPVASPAAEPEARTNASPDNRATVLVKLEEADAFDGTTDKIVSKCAKCGLRMDGSAEHTVMVDGYTLHLCSDQCRELAEKNPDQTILALNIEKK